MEYTISLESVYFIAGLQRMNPLWEGVFSRDAPDSLREETDGRFRVIHLFDR